MAGWVGVSGPIASGKTAVAICLADALEAPVASFGSYVRSEAGRRQLPADRPSLQELGETLIEEMGWERFCLAVLDHGGVERGASAAVIDGIRHVAALERLEHLAAPAPFHLVFLDVPASVRATRFEVGGVSPEDLAMIEDHPTELQVGAALRDRAAVVVSGSDSIALCRDARTALERL
jgi:dephospho-CoA kinase